ncbi:type II secretion system minor pseudopilin GspK [Hydrogenophaga palleronii]|uniref:type II secretion system minor pseudopilin GspK n=1 Tax=Hydrogenophaga palleronii TaxID=65655 RepID=UPI0008260458|nr:type II secretion system minor pseudopilin GspK [Hydrogenophaga palleronii]
MARQLQPVRARQRGAALLLAMLVVTLVATLASAALWQQWRATEVEQAERQRVQAGWVLTGALDWARLILREDARGNQSNGNGDHLGEPWAMPLEEARLSSFLAADKNNTSDHMLEAFLSGEVIDMQSHLNFLNLVRTVGAGAQAKVELSEPDLLAFTKLYGQLGLPASELTTAANELRNTMALALSDPMPSRTALLPRKYAQLGWLGISRSSLALLEPHVTVLPTRTSLNLNTASAEAISASVPGMDMAQARQVVTAREREPFRSLANVTEAVPALSGKLSDLYHGVRSNHFMVRGRLRLDNTIIEERSLVVRNNLDVRVAWRERFARP